MDTSSQEVNFRVSEIRWVGLWMGRIRRSGSSVTRHLRNHHIHNHQSMKPKIYFFDDEIG